MQNPNIKFVNFGGGYDGDDVECEILDPNDAPSY